MRRLQRLERAFRLVSDCRAVNKQDEEVRTVMPDDTAEMTGLLGAARFETLDMLRGYWQMRLAADTRNIFTIATPDGLFPPTRVPQGVLNATRYHQGMMTKLSTKLNVRCALFVLLFILSFFVTL